MLLAHKVSKVSRHPSRSPASLIAQVHYEPLGLVAALVSWNYSFHNLISPILAALFAGNTIVVKCSEQVAWSSAWYIGGIKACLRACGMDEDVVQLVICLPDLAETVTKNELVRHITCEYSYWNLQHMLSRSHRK
jgi:acyl-CoA reductase-like NAD-dependent aldehyde dehydrogenase